VQLQLDQCKKHLGLMLCFFVGAGAFTETQFRTVSNLLVIGRS
jgi:hypothetical protein